MRSKLFLGCAAVLALFATVHSVAQSVKPDALAIKADLQLMIDAVKFREAATQSVTEGTESPAAAINRIKAFKAASGLKVSADEDFAFATSDIGQRLIALEKPELAVEFFRAAEGALVAATKKSDLSSRSKAQLLSRLSAIRGNYLNKAAQAKLDIEEAIQLQPEDEALRQLRGVLADGRAETFEKAKQ